METVAGGGICIVSAVDLETLLEYLTQETCTTQQGLVNVVCEGNQEKCALDAQLNRKVAGQHKAHLTR